MLKNLETLANESVHPGQIDMIRKMTEALNDSVNLMFANESVTHIKEVGRAFDRHWEQHMAKRRSWKRRRAPVDPLIPANRYRHIGF